MAYTLDATAQASWRTHPVSTEFFLFLHTPSIVFMAQTNMPPATYPLYLFLYDNVMIGNFNNIKEDMMLLLGTMPGADDLGRVRIRKNLSGVTATSSIIYIQRSSQGILDGEIDMQNDAYVTVLDFFPLWSIPQLIDSNGIMYEDSEIAFSDAIHLLPVANAGVDFLEVLESVGSTVQKTFGENTSYATAPGATISSRLWTFPDGQTSSLAAPTITFTANTIGYYSLAVTDSLGNVKTSRRYMAVVAKNHPLLIRDWEIESHVARPDGQEMSIIIHDPIPYGQYIDGIECLISMRERRGTTLGGLVGSTGFENMIFAGYLGQEDMRGEAGVEGYLADTTFTLLDNVGRLKTLPGFTELKEREGTTRTTWTHMNGANIDRYVVSILDHRSNALRRMDMVWSGTGETYAFTVLGSDGGNLYDQADGRCQAIGYKLTCDRYGRLQMRPDPQLQAETSKTTDVIVPIRETDWSSLKRVYGRSPTTHWNWGESIAVSTANASAGSDIGTFWNVSPGNAPGQGLAAQTSGEQLAASQEELNIRERHRYERLNNLFKGNVEVLIANDGYFCDPALMKWVQLEITSQHAGVRGRSWISTTRFLPLEMNYQYDHENGIRTQRIVLEKEIVTSRMAVTYAPPDNAGFTDPGSPTYQQPDIQPFIDPNAGLYAGTNGIALLRGDSVSGISGLVFTGNFTAASPTWSAENWQDGTTLDFLDAAEYIVDGVQKPGTARTLFTATNTKARVFNNILSGTTLGLTYALRATSALRIVQAERGNPNICYILTSYSDGIWSEGHINGVAITANRIGDATYQSLFRPALFVDPNNPLIAYTISRNGSGKIRIFKTTNGGVSWLENADYQWNTVATSSGCSKPADNVTHGIFISRSFQDPLVMYIGGKDANASWPIYRCTSSTNVIISFLNSGTCASFTGWAGPTNRRGFRTFDTDRNLLLSQMVLVGDVWGLYKSVDRGDNWTAIRSTGVTSVEPLPSVYMGGDGSVYECINDAIRFHPNVYNLTADAQFTDKTGTGYPTGSFLPIVLFGV